MEIGAVTFEDTFESWQIANDPSSNLMASAVWKQVVNGVRTN
jgi:hypothetical protein